MSVCLSVCLSVNGVMRDGGLLLVSKYFVIHNFLFFFSILVVVVRNLKKLSK